MVLHGTRGIVYLCIVVIVLLAIYMNIGDIGERDLSGTVVSSHKDIIPSRQGNELRQELQSDTKLYDTSKNLDELGLKTDLITTKKEDETNFGKESIEIFNRNKVYNRSGVDNIGSQDIDVGITLAPQMLQSLFPEKDQDLLESIKSSSSHKTEEPGDPDDKFNDDDDRDNNDAEDNDDDDVEENNDYEGSAFGENTNKTVMKELIDDYEAEDGDNDEENVDDMNDAISEVEYMIKLKDRFESRKKLAKEGCLTHHNPVYSVTRTMKRFLFYSYKYNLMVCAVAKTGASTWKSHLLEIKGISTKGVNVHRGNYDQMIRARSILGKSLNTKLPKSIKVLTVRHPLDRLVSAYRDKFNGGKTVAYPGPLSIRYFWHPAGHRLQKSLKSSGKYKISFFDFLRQVILDHWSGVENAHWSKMYGTCSPCQISYDYIMKTETYSEDLAYIVKVHGIKEVNANERRHGLSGGLPTQSTQASDHNSLRLSTLQYYLDIPISMMDKLEKIYHTDMDIFGYEFPSDIRKAINDYRERTMQENGT